MEFHKSIFDKGGIFGLSVYNDASRVSYIVQPNYWCFCIVGLEEDLFCVPFP